MRLQDGRYLVALGRSGGREYGFYVGDTPVGPFAFCGAAEPGLWGENAAIVTEAGTGTMYFFQFEGYGSGDDVDQAHLYRLRVKQGRYRFEYVKSRTFRCRGERVDGAGDWAHFDAGAGLYVTPSGRLIIYATDWHQSDAGNVRMVEFRQD